MDFRKGFGQLNQTASLSSTLNSSLNSSINISSAMGAGGYQHYGLNALGEATLALRVFFFRFFFVCLLKFVFPQCVCFFEDTNQYFTFFKSFKNLFCFN